MIVPILAGNPGAMTGPGNWTYLLPGKVPALIDAGVGKPDHLNAIAARLPGGPAHVIVSHAHDDHALGVGELAQRWPAARFWKYRWPDRDARYHVPWNYLVDGQMFPAGDDELQVVHTPGHAPDHVCLWHARTRTLFGADLLVLGTTVVIPASTGGDLADYLASLARIDALNASRILPAHGEPIDDPHTLIRAYVDHRLERERQVWAAVSEGRTTIAAIAGAIYVGLPPVLRAMARESVLAHLIKLERDGVVCRRGDNWLPRGDNRRPRGD